MSQTFRKHGALPRHATFASLLAITTMLLFGCGANAAKQPPAAPLATPKTISDFETGTPGQWQAEANSSAGLAPEAAHGGSGGLKWTLHSDGQNPYGNSISVPVNNENWTKYGALQLDFYSAGPLSGRIGCQIISEGKQLTLPDLNARAKPGAWTNIQISLADVDAKSVSKLSFFCDAVGFGKGDHVFYLDNVSLLPPRPEAKPEGKPLPLFSVQPASRQNSIRRALAAPPQGQRRAPYSVPMYYQQWGGGTPDGKVHADWQEALIKDWAELGLTKLHLYLYPPGNGTPSRNYAVSENTREGLAMFTRLCEKYKLKIGLRIDPSYDYEAKTEAADYWPCHPNNPNNEIKEYSAWLTTTLGLLKGRLEYVILGDEINWTNKGDGHDWNAAVTTQYIKTMSAVIHKADPAAKVCMFSAESGKWNQVVQLIKEGYAEYGDAIAINHYDYQVLQGYMNELKQLVPNKKMLFLSNGVGYISSDTALRSPATDPYSRYNDRDQASMIARTMFTWWALGADVAPYYVPMRHSVYHGKVTPQWYGFFGFQDLVVDDNDKATIKRYPAWYAYQTIATVFNDRPSYSEPAFKVSSDNPTTAYLKSYVRGDKELSLILWGEGSKPQKTNVHIDSAAYSYPILVDLLNNKNWSDVTATLDASGKGITLWNVPLSTSPSVIRLVNSKGVR